MKRYVKSTTYISGMSFGRKIIIPKLENYAKVINAHVIECVVYSEIRYLTIRHWVKELAAWMNAANKLKCDSKLKERDYLKSLFAEFGNNVLDAEVNLDQYKLHNSELPEDKQYPDFEITDNLVNNLFKAYQGVIKVSLPILMSKDILKADEWVEILLPIFN